MCFQFKNLELTIKLNITNISTKKMKHFPIIVVSFVFCIVCIVVAQGPPPRTLEFIPFPLGGCLANGIRYRWFGTINDTRFFDNSTADPINPLYVNVHVKGACYDLHTLEEVFPNVEYTFQRPIAGISENPTCTAINIQAFSNFRNPVQFPNYQLVLGWQWVFSATPGDEYFQNLLCRAARMFRNLDRGGLVGLVQQLNHILDLVTRIQQPN